LIVKTENFPKISQSIILKSLTFYYFMKFDEVNAISTAVVSFATIIGLMAGFYFSMIDLNMSLFYVVLFEFVFISIMILFVLWIKRKINNESL